jgi:hypothetical protein
MLTKTLTCIASGLILIVSAAGVWSQINTQSINRIVTDANDHFQLGADLHNQVRPKYNAFDEAIHAFPAGRPELERRARELAELYARSAEQYRLAAARIGEAAAQSFDPDVKNYFQSKSDRWTKSADVRELLAKYLLVVTDPAVATHGEFMAHRAEIDARIIVLNKEEKELEAKAEKLFTEHRAKFD